VNESLAEEVIQERVGPYRLTDLGVAKTPDLDGLARSGRASSSLREGSLPGPKMVSEDIFQGQ
jgi:hypothetical protein